jgi:peptidoglycan/xylan/chitin deacetylase (PgdA/CDA1 family)
MIAQMNNKSIRMLIFKLLRYSGLPFLFREVIQKQHVTILLFHAIPLESADTAFKYLMKHYTIIGLNDFFNSCREKKPLPEKSLIITFDDGHRSNYDLLPLFKRYAIPVTIFLCSGIIDTNRHFWFSITHPDYSTEQLKKVPNREKLNILKEIGFEPEINYSHPQALSKEQIREMSPFVNFQSHTVFHPCLHYCDDDEARQEISMSKKMLEQEYSFMINAIAYPNGDYTERDIQFCIDAGYEFGLTVDYGFNTPSTDPFKLRRISVNDTGNMDELIVKASGVWGFLKTNIMKIANIFGVV